MDSLRPEPSDPQASVCETGSSLLAALEGAENKLGFFLTYGIKGLRNKGADDEVLNRGNCKTKEIDEKNERPV